MYSIELSRLSEKQLCNLEKDKQIRIISSLNRIRIRPYPYISNLVGSPYFRLRAGDFRIILDIRADRLIILVIEIGRRKNIYKRL